MCNRKTKQWHIKPTLAEYKIMNVYCIVNKLKTVSKWDKMMEEVTAKVLPSLLRTCDWEAVKGCERGWADERGTHCHLVFAISGTEQVRAIPSSVDMESALCTNRFNYRTDSISWETASLNSHVVEHFYAQWCQFSSFFLNLKKKKRCVGVGGPLRILKPPKIGTTQVIWYGRKKSD